LRAAPVVGIILIIVGVISLAYQGITYTTHKKLVDVGSVHATVAEHKTIPLPPIVGVLALLGGVALLASDKRTT
jgi:hypothetical protein